MSRPNIVYLHSHDTGRYVEPYGYGIRTPNLQRLAEQGMLFRQAHNAAPTCSPSRAALLTGMCPHSAGQLGLVNRGFDLPDPRHHLVHTLRAAGYHTTLAGVQHVRWDPRTIGYHQILETGGRKAREVAPAAAEFLAAAPPQPFFLTVGFSETHRVFPAPAPADDARYLRPPAPIPDTPETRADMAAYQASVTALDQGIGMVLGALEAAGLADDTLVICTTDHGPAFPRMKCNLTDHGTGVMLILRGPGGFCGGRVSDALVSQIDLFPTLCELLQVEPPAWLQGRSLLPLVRGEAEEINDAVFAEVNYHGQYEPQRMIRTTALEVHPPLPGARRSLAGQLRQQPDQGAAAGARLGQPADGRGAALRPGVRSQRGGQPGGRPAPRRYPGRVARAADAVDGGDR